MPPHSAEKIAEARRLWEAGELNEVEIGLRTGMSSGGIRGRAKREGWTRPRAPGRDAALRAADRVSLVTRLFRSFERQITDLEKRFASAEGGADEKDARMLAVLAKTFETLNGLKAEEDRKNDVAVDLDQLRQALAKRLERLDPGGAEPGGGDRAADAG
ncbi:hypothetical protein C3941_08685 [Kaistia algarum]|uniref:hypothetical protein n=1 Tax=Kaistia algarum TaxID=2083279 RepID=UPI000CE89FE1|nr:hypothetical protein [Kaistia algarum]MCX5512132.1 hypothetical protein [Kaistia algarum]PPE80241.1 hypothetical protein C3941_08685 [Kaistia algarum]